MEKTMKDPVCGMTVTHEDICTTYEGRHFCFCSKACYQAFDEAPEKFARKVV